MSSRQARTPSQSSDAKLFLEMTALTEEGANLVQRDPQFEEVLKTTPNYVPALMAKAAILLKSQRPERCARNLL